MVISLETPLVRKDYMPKPFYRPDYDSSQRCQPTVGFNCPFPVYSGLNMFHQAIYPYSYRYQDFNYHCQDFDYFVVIDFEATCDRGKPPSPQEIIEFPSVVVSSSTGQIVASFQTYVRPTCNRVLTDFCKELTGIQQTQVDKGITLSKAIVSHDQWLEKIGLKTTKFAVVTWSDWDCEVMLESECRYKHIEKPAYFNRWINLKVPFGEVFGKERCNLKQAVERAGLTWEGRAHCGLDDAKNTARLVGLMINRGFKFTITNSLTCQSSDDESDNDMSTWKPNKTVPYAFNIVPNVFIRRTPVGAVFVGSRNWAGPRRVYMS
ncbi:Unknown protein [Striga hermonthica]|uniref:Exonuclease domain-containing protein n=1 Tax=Striga hermonthica TaxID=68872 RepID=A0A9N7NC49_STRHE|nr:Unknown protein [Striga hermonthica]